MRGNPLRWFENYLQNRNQVVKVDDTIFSSQTINCGKEKTLIVIKNYKVIKLLYDF